MRKILIIFLTVVLALGGCSNYKNEIQEKEQLAGSTENETSLSDSNSGEDFENGKRDDEPDENDETEQVLLLKDVLAIEAEDVISVEIQYRNYYEIKSALVENEDAEKVAGELLALEIEEFDKKKFNPITGGDKKYIITTKNGITTEIIDNGSLTINNEEKYLLINWKYTLSIPDDLTWSIEEQKDNL